MAMHSTRLPIFCSVSRIALRTSQGLLAWNSMALILPPPLGLRLSTTPGPPLVSSLGLSTRTCCLAYWRRISARRSSAGVLLLRIGPIMSSSLPCKCESPCSSRNQLQNAKARSAFQQFIIITRLGDRILQRGGWVVGSLKIALPRGLKPTVPLAQLTARLKPCPFKTESQMERWRGLRCFLPACAATYLSAGYLETALSSASTAAFITPQSPKKRTRSPESV